MTTAVPYQHSLSHVLELEEDLKAVIRLASTQSQMTLHLQTQSAVMEYSIRSIHAQGCCTFKSGVLERNPLLESSIKRPYGPPLHRAEK